MNLFEIEEKLETTHDAEDCELAALIEGMRKAWEAMTPDTVLAAMLAERDRSDAPEENILLYTCRKARGVRETVYGRDLYLRGLIEFTNFCKNNCYYCGIRAGNGAAERYRLTMEDILSCTDAGYAMGLRTFVLQGGEDPYFTDERVCQIVSAIRERHPDCAITLSIGEKSRASYQAYFDAGANRFLLRHETADEAHYRKLHPEEMSLANRKRCLRDLKEIGYQVGCGMMIGSPYQTTEHLIEDLRFMQELQPHMIGIGPFIPHQGTPFRDRAAGTLGDTVILLAITRLVFPEVLLPATTALGTIHPKGREIGMLAGANVIMPNLSPEEVRSKYLLYDGKITAGPEAAENHRRLEEGIRAIGYQVVTSRGDHVAMRT